MKYFYSENYLTKKGQGIGGTFNGPSIKDILQESMLNKLEALLPSSKDVGVAINYLRNLRELHRNSLVSFNSKRAGFSPAWDLTLRKKSSPRPTVYSPIALLQ